MSNNKTASIKIKELPVVEWIVALGEPSHFEASHACHASQVDQNGLIFTKEESFLNYVSEMGKAT